MAAASTTPGGSASTPIIYDFTDAEIPQRFINGVNNDMVEARRRWDLTKKFRAEERLDNILNEPHPHFETIKAIWPHYLAGRSKEGNLIYWERPGEISIDKITQGGLTQEILLRHWIYITEYQWEVGADGDNMAKSITIIDIDNVGIGALVGTTLEFVKKSITYANHHYPERSLMIYILNAPWYFTGIWNIIKPWVHENTQKKVNICGKSTNLSELKKNIDEDNIPVYYGGKMVCGDTPEQRANKDCCRFWSKDAVDMSNFVKRVNEGLPGAGLGRAPTSHRVTPKVDASSSSSSSSSSTTISITSTTTLASSTGSTSGGGVADGEKNTL